MKPDSANVFNTIGQARTYRDKFRPLDCVAKVGKKLVIVTQEQAQRLNLTIAVPPAQQVRHYRSLERWRSDAKKRGCKVRITTRWAAGGGHHIAVHPERGIVGFYDCGTMEGRKLNSGHLHI
jgi:hypothetical protein